MMAALHRLFTVFWYCLVVASIGAAIVFVWMVRADYVRRLSMPTTPDVDPLAYIIWGVAGVLATTLPYAALTIIRWIATGRWRFGPRW